MKRIIHKILHNIIDRFRKKKVINMAVEQLLNAPEEFKWDGDYIYYKGVVYYVSLKENFIMRTKDLYENFSV